MRVEEPPITGAEPISENPGGEYAPRACLVRFYRAFNQRDLALMCDVWSQGEEVSMSNPLGDVRRGWTEIRAVYERIFQGRAHVYVEFYDYSLHVGEDMFCAVGRERGYVDLESGRIDLAIRTSRIFRREGRFWKQLHHHGSIDDAALLARYQTSLKSNQPTRTPKENEQ